MPESKNEKNQGNDKLDLGVLGSSGLKQQGGIIDEEFHPRLRGDYGPKVYREMADNSSTIGAIRYIIRSLVRSVDWRVEPVTMDEEGAAAAEFLESCLLDMDNTFEDFISEVLSFLDYGWAFFEVTHKIRRGKTKDKSTRSQFEDGKVGWRSLALRAQDTRERWQFNPEDDALEGMWQATDTKPQVFIPIEKALLFRTETYKDNPEGRSMYRNSVVDYFYLKRISEIEAIGIERDMTGLLVMEVPLEILATTASSEAQALRGQFESMLSQLKRDEREFAMVPAEMDKQNMPTGYKLKLLASGGNRQVDTDKAKLFYKTSILQSVVAQFIQLGMNGVGSFALSSNQTDLFAIALGSYLDIIASTFNRFAISRLMELNGFPNEVWPELVHGDLESPALADMGTYIQALAASGQLPEEDETLQRKLLEIANLPMPEKVEGEEDEEVAEVEKSVGGLRSKYFDKSHRGCSHKAI